MTVARALVLFLACTLLFVERFPLDGIVHTELRGQLCTHNSEPHVHMESRTYERTQQQDGTYAVRLLTTAGGDAEGWQLVKDVRLYVTTDAPAGSLPGVMP